jgi:hypothetical protein
VLAAWLRRLGLWVALPAVMNVWKLTGNLKSEHTRCWETFCLISTYLLQVLIWNVLVEGGFFFSMVFFTGLPGGRNADMVFASELCEPAWC